MQVIENEYFPNNILIMIRKGGGVIKILLILMSVVFVFLPFTSSVIQLVVRIRHCDDSRAATGWTIKTERAKVRLQHPPRYCSVDGSLPSGMSRNDERDRSDTVVDLAARKTPSRPPIKTVYSATKVGRQCVGESIAARKY